MRNIILAQRKERDELLARQYISRQLRYNREDILASRFIKLITGPRRVGKSVYALLLLKDKNFAYLNFDDMQLLDNWNEDLVMATLAEVYPDYDYLLLDEVQNLDKWDLWVSKLYRLGINIVITGSNARMLSSEMATVLTGRYVQIEMLPFSLEETFTWHHINLHHIAEEQQTESIMLLDSYLHNGGFPEIMANRNMAKNYLSTLFDSILLKDVAQRHKVRKTHDLYNVATYLLSNFCGLFSYNELATAVGIASVATTKKFCDYLHEPYLFFYLPRYNNKLKLMKKAAQKVYVVDNGFVQSSGFNLSENLGRLLENQVFVELLRHGYDVETSMFYYRSANNREVDFVLRSGTKVVQLIQVCYDMSAPKTRKRETDALVECARELKCNNLSVVTYSEKTSIEQDGYTIRLIPISEF